MRTQIGGSHLEARSASESQFSIFHLLIATTVIAIAISLIQCVLSLGNFNQGVGIPAWTIVGFCGIFIFVMALLTTLSMAIVFAPRKIKIWIACILCAAFALIPVAVIPNLVTVIGGPVTRDDTMFVATNIVSFSIAHSTTLILVLSLYYALGFRLRRRVLADQSQL